MNVDVTSGGTSCGLIKVWKTRYSAINRSFTVISCGLIKVWKTRYIRLKFFVRS